MHFSPVFEDDKVEYYYKKSSNKKAFDYYKEPSQVSFNDLSSKTLRAGLQRLTQDMPKPGPLYCSGSDNARKRIWLEFKMMNLEAKGFTMSGYKPTADDLKELEQRKADYAALDKNWKKAPELPMPSVPDSPAPTLPVQDEKPQEKPKEDVVEENKQVEQDELEKMGIKLDDESKQEFEKIKSEENPEPEPEPEPEKPKTKTKWF